MRTIFLLFLFAVIAISENQTVNDPLFPGQWGLKILEVPKAWSITQGSKKLAIVIIDTGIDYEHPDLKDNMWVNPNEIPNNGIDDDKNGYIDDIHGINTITGSGDSMDDEGHGTFQAGIIGAKSNNGLGIAGVMPEVSLIACKFLDSRGSGITDDAIKCLNYVANLAHRDDTGVTIIATVNSWGGGSSSEALFDAIKKHESLGILFVGTAGNSGTDLDEDPVYPAAYKLSNMIVTAKMNEEGRLADLSSYGPNSVHVAMPGINILSTSPKGAYITLSGSAATAFLAGVIGLTKSAHPSLSPLGVKEKILKSTIAFVDDEDKAKLITGGYVSAYKSVCPD